VIVILFTPRAPNPLTEGLAHQGHTIYEAIAISEVYALADQHPQAQIIITADIDPERAKAIQHHYPTMHLKPAATLKGWAAIARFIGTTPASAQTWAKQGMPVKREGRFTIADPAEIQAWLGQQSHMPKPAHILTNDTDIAAALKESISVLRRKR
jgi:hypothetical protein